ncbi:MAG: retropepsin-like aspartic protease [Bacteroidia bacterium]
MPLLVITAVVDGYELRLAIDTGASHSVIDLTCLLLSGYSATDAVGDEEYETANGTIQARLFRLRQFEAIGIIRNDLTVSSYDFLGQGVLSDIDGLLGLDFLEGRHLCIDMARKTITL